MNSRAGEERACPGEAAHLLVIDDDTRIRALLARYLTMQGYRVTTAASSADAKSRMQSLAFDLLVLDVMMPGESGISLAREVRQGQRGAGVPIIFLTANGEVQNRIEGFEAGGDDYLAKPFDPRELTLRIASLLRRSKERQTVVGENRAVHFGQFHFDLPQGDLRRGDKRIALAEREREMLRLLAGARGEVVPRQALAQCGTPCNERSVDVQINRLRRKLEGDPSDPAYLITARGTGYRLALDG
jgi:two-component system phosphate regulon response regulator OmpR